MTLRSLFPWACVLLSLAALSCKSEGSTPSQPQPPPNDTRKVKVTFDNRGNPVMADGTQPTAAPGAAATAQVAPPDTKGGVVCRPPADWKSSPPTSPMRMAQYAVPRAQGDTEDAELAVFYFGPTGAGGVDETFQRWMAAFDPEATAKARRAFRMSGAHEVQSIEVSGAFDVGKTMSAPAQDAGTQKESALLGAILQTSEGPYYFKLTGPVKTVAAARQPFDKMLDTCAPGGPAPAASSASPPPGSAPAASPR